MTLTDKQGMIRMSDDIKNSLKVYNTTKTGFGSITVLGIIGGDDPEFEIVDQIEDVKTLVGVREIIANEIKNDESRVKFFVTFLAGTSKSEVRHEKLVVIDMVHQNCLTKQKVHSTLGKSTLTTAVSCTATIHLDDVADLDEAAVKKTCGFVTVE